MSNHQVDADHQSGELAHLQRKAEVQTGPPIFTDTDLRRLARQLQMAEEAGYVMRKRWHCSNYRHSHRWQIAARLCVLLKG